MTAQGIFPGNPAPDAFRMPYDFEPVIRLRMFYKNTDTLTGGEQEAWVLGGFAGLRSPWFGDLFQFAVVGYASQKLYGPSGKGGTLLLQSDQSSIYVLGEAWGAVRVAGQTIAGYRQLIDRPFINPQDTREIPNTFEAYTLTGASGALSYTGGYMTKMKTRASEDFIWASKAAGGTGDNKGVIYAGATYAFAGTGFRQGRRGVFDRRVTTRSTSKAGIRSPSTTRRASRSARNTIRRSRSATTRSDISRPGATASLPH